MSNNGNIMCVHLASIEIAEQNYTFTFNINEKLDDLNITLLIDGSPITVPFDCVRELFVLCNSIILCTCILCIQVFLMRCAIVHSG